MAILRMQTMQSLDGFVNDAEGKFDWHTLDAGVHEHSHAEGQRDGLAIYGRRMYEAMLFWQTYDGGDPFYENFARYWKSLDKIVVSKSLKAASSDNTLLVADLGEAEMRKIKRERGGDISISGPTIAARYLDAGLVDEIGIYTAPIMVGAGLRAFQNRRRARLERVEFTPFANGVSFSRYKVLN